MVVINNINSIVSLFWGGEEIGAGKHYSQSFFPCFHHD